MIAKVLRIIASGMPRREIVASVTRIKMQDWWHLLLVAHVTVAIHCRHRAQRELQRNLQHALQRNSQLGNQHEREWVISFVEVWSRGLQCAHFVSIGPNTCLLMQSRAGIREFRVRKIVEGVIVALNMIYFTWRLLYETCLRTIVLNRW